jgi:L-malate glycosyltransferase
MDTPAIPVAFVLHVMQVAGAEMLVAETIRRLGSRLSPVVVCIDRVGQLGEIMRGEGVEVLALDRRPGLDLAVSRRLATILRERRIRVVHAHQYTPFFYAALAKLQLGHRTWLMLTEHGRHYPDVVSWQRRWANRLVLSRLADEVNAVASFSARALQAREGFPPPIEVVENGIDVHLYGVPSDRAAAKRSVGLAEHRRHIVCVARLHPVKDHAMLLRAFAIVARRIADVDLVLAGDGELRGTLEAQSRELGLQRRVLFLGIRRDVPALLRAAELFALVSVSEGASLTVLEAMASGLPSVLTAVGGNPELVRHEQEGLLVPRGDDAAAAAAFIELLEHPERGVALGKKARERALATFQLERTVQRYAQKYQAAYRAVSST